MVEEPSEEVVLAAYGKLVELVNWDSHGAPAPNLRAISIGVQVLGGFIKANCLPTSIDPHADGGVCLSFGDRRRYADIDCLNSGEVFAVTSLGGDETKVWQVGSDALSLESAIQTIHNFISGHDGPAIEDRVD